MGDRGALSGEATGSPPCSKAAPSPASYPGTVVKAWHAGDALVSLLAFLQEGRWAGLLPLGTVPTDALGGRGEERRGKGRGLSRPGRARWEAPSPAWQQASTRTSQPQPCGGLAPSSGDPIPALALRFLQEEALVGPRQSHFPDRRVGEAEGPPEAPSVPAVPAAGARWEDTPRGLGLQRPVPNSFSGSKGGSCRSSQAFADTWGGARPLSPADPNRQTPSSLGLSVFPTRRRSSPLALWEFDGSYESSSQKNETHS